MEHVARFRIPRAIIDTNTLLHCTSGVSITKPSTLMCSILHNCQLEQSAPHHKRRTDQTLPLPVQGKKPLETGTTGIMLSRMRPQRTSRKRTVSISGTSLLMYPSPCFKLPGRLAMKHHPDNNPDDPHADKRFKEIAIA
jgi:hypothetical protein